MYVNDIALMCSRFFEKGCMPKSFLCDIIFPYYSKRCNISRYLLWILLLKFWIISYDFNHTYSLGYKYQEDNVIHTLLYDNKNTTDENIYLNKNCRFSTIILFSWMSTVSYDKFITKQQAYRTGNNMPF